MKRSGTLVRRLAIGLLSTAVWMLPRSRADWASAMQSELHYLNTDRQAVLWAAGCCLAVFKVRMIAMFSYRVSPWIFCAEMMLCFVPLSIGWLDSLFGGSGLLRLNLENIHRYFIGAAGDEAVLAMLFSGAILGIVGPIALVIAFRLVVLGRPLKSPWLRSALVAGPLLYGALTLMARYAVVGRDSFGFNTADAFDLWNGVLLLSLLPALGAAHLLFLGVGRGETTAVA